MGAAFIRSAYSLLGTLLTPALNLWLERRARRGKEDPFRMGERFGYASLPRPEGTLVWLHAASVGEAQSVLTLVRALLAQHAFLSVLITTGTVTSAALIAQQHLPRAVHQFLPVDTLAAVRRFLNHWQPDMALWVESEFWPQLLWQMQEQRIPTLLINARISQRTFEGWKRWPRTIHSLLQNFTSIYAGSAEDAARLRALGAGDVREAGNLKYDAAPLPVDSKLLDELRRQMNDRRVMVAASTHANEEHYIAHTHAHVAQQFPSLLSVIVPRHATRGDAIAADLRAQGFILSQRSKGEVITPDTQLYLADSMGELGSFYSIADLVFMGGSLIAHGGQNPLEAARFGKALLTGPHTHNFASIIAAFTAANAIEIVADKDALAHAIARLLADDTTRKNLAQHAALVVEQHRGASSIILQHCAELLPRSSA
jgi:3-deoxy-D-manno-octulosonic-acid transferase